MPPFDSCALGFSGEGKAGRGWMKGSVVLLYPCFYSH